MKTFNINVNVNVIRTTNIIHISPFVYNLHGVLGSKLVLHQKLKKNIYSNSTTSTVYDTKRKVLWSNTAPNYLYFWPLLILECSAGDISTVILNPTLAPGPDGSETQSERNWICLTGPAKMCRG